MLRHNSTCKLSLMTVSSCVNSLKGKHMSSIQLKKSSELSVLSLLALRRQWPVMKFVVQLEQLKIDCITSQADACNILLNPRLLAVASHQSRVQTLVVTESKLLGESLMCILHGNYCSPCNDGLISTVSRAGMTLQFAPCPIFATCRTAGGTSRQ